MEKKDTLKKVGKKFNKDVFEVAMDQLKGFARKGAGVGSLQCIPTGHFNLDFAMHFGMLPIGIDLSAVEGYDRTKPPGIPLGKIVHIYGNEGSGKSSLCYRIVANAQKMKLPCMWFDLEQSFAENLAVVNGVDLAELYIGEKPDSAEKILEQVITAIEAGIKLIIIDSVASLIPKEEMEGSIEDQQMALKARVLSRGVPKIVTAAAENKATVIFINQLREKPGSYGDSETPTGGNALKFNSSITLRLSKRTAAKDAIFIEDPDQPGKKRYIGHYSGLKIDKNRFAKPLVDENGSRMLISIPVYFESYFPNIEEVAFDTGRQLQLITVRGGVYKWEENKAEGMRNFVDQYLKDENNLVTLIQQIKDISQKENVVIPYEILSFDPKGKRAKRVEVDEKEVQQHLKVTDKSLIIKKEINDDGDTEEVS